MHGGKSFKGFASPNFKHGRNSKFLNHLPDSIKERFTENLSHKEASVLDEIALTTLHLQEHAQLLDDSTILERWNELKAAIESARRVILEPSKLTAKEQKQNLTPQSVFDRITELVESHSRNNRVWKKIHEINEKQRKLQMTYSRIQLNNTEYSIKANQYVPVEYVRQFVKTVAGLFDMSPEDIRLEQFRALQAKYNAMPENIKNAPSSEDEK
jgi:hypothetical protein